MPLIKDELISYFTNKPDFKNHDIPTSGAVFLYRKYHVSIIKDLKFKYEYAKPNTFDKLGRQINGTSVPYLDGCLIVVGWSCGEADCYFSCGRHIKIQQGKPLTDSRKKEIIKQINIYIDLFELGDGKCPTHRTKTPCKQRTQQLLKNQRKMPC